MLNAIGDGIINLSRKKLFFKYLFHLLSDDIHLMCFESHADMEQHRPVLILCCLMFLVQLAKKDDEGSHRASANRRQ